jgi:hypothetical protein
MSLIGNVVVEVMFDFAFTWTDVTAYVRSGQINRGSSRSDGVLVRYEASTASVVLSNLDARFDPTNLSGPYVWGSGSQILPGVPFRIRSSYGAGYYLWRGFADSWDLAYPDGAKDAICTLSGTDATKALDGLAATAYTPPAELSGSRITGLLSLWGFTGDVDAGNSTMQGYAVDNPSTWAEMQLVADSELGELYVNGGGTVVFRQRDALFTDARSVTSQGTFGDVVGELRYQDVHLINDDVQLKNLVHITNLGGGEQTASDTDSRTYFGDHEFSRTGLLLTTDAEAADYAGYVVGLSSGARVEAGVVKLYGDTRVDSLTIDPRRDPTNLNPQVLGRELGDRITVKLRPPGRAASPISRDAFIRGIAHSFTPDSWSTVWALQDATRFSVLAFDHATLGRLEWNVFGY